MSNKENDPQRRTNFYLTAYIKKIKEELRQTQRWLAQAEKNVNNPNPASIARYKEKIFELQQKIENVHPSDEEFLDYMESELAQNSEAQTNYSKRMETTLKEKKEQQQRLDDYYENQRLDRRKDRQLQWQMKKDYERLLSIDASMPSYMRENLQQFPNNKGYIFKGVWYFGQQPVQYRRGEDPDLYVMFEKKFPSQAMHIHEIKHGHFHRVYEKKQKNSPRVLLEDRMLIRKAS